MQVAAADRRVIYTPQYIYSSTIQAKLFVCGPGVHQATMCHTTAAFAPASLRYCKWELAKRRDLNGLSLGWQRRLVQLGLTGPDDGVRKCLLN